MRISTGAACLWLTLWCTSAASQKARCPDGMVPAREGVCIDIYEWPNVRGGRPLVHASGLEDDRTNTVLDADLLCSLAHKRVCDIAEWQSACGDKYPYGDTFDPTACNTEKKWRSVDEAKIDRWDKAELKRLDQSEPSGSYERCRSPSGAYDMVGNAEEWVKCAEGAYGWCLMGRYWGERGSCTFVVKKHAPRWHFYETGFRCCKDMKTED